MKKASEMSLEEVQSWIGKVKHFFREEVGDAGKLFCKNCDEEFSVKDKVPTLLKHGEKCKG